PFKFVMRICEQLRDYCATPCWLMIGVDPRFYHITNVWYSFSFETEWTAKPLSCLKVGYLSTKLLVVRDG
ncbi:hypothetical protein L9F63_004295, partial [Diploptera punctata]